MSNRNAHVVSAGSSTSSLKPRDFARGWWRVLNGYAPVLSIEITRECPLRCPGCYAYGDKHLGGTATLRDLSDVRGDALVQGVLELVRRHRPMHVSLVGGEPMIRHRELNRILPALDKMGVHAMVVTSGLIAIPQHWMELRRLRVAVSVDGLSEHHDERRKPATYERILKNIGGRRVNIHWVITRPMLLARASYLEEYVSFWDARPEVDHLWVSLYSPQTNEESAERLTNEDRERVARALPPLRRKYPKLLITEGVARAFVKPPESPEKCLFSRLSTNYSADLRSRVEPCVFGGTPDCNQCGCSISTVLHWVGDMKILGRLNVGHLVRASLYVGLAANRLRGGSTSPSRWQSEWHRGKPSLVQIHTQEQDSASGCS